MTPRPISKAVLLLCLATLAACAQYSLVEAQRRTIGGAYSLEPQIAWSRHTSGKVETWTVDGPGLEALQLFVGLGDGDPLFDRPAFGPDKPRPRYRAGMTPSEIQEFVVDSLARSGKARVQASDLRPAPFGAASGFRFELRFVNGEGLEMAGTVMGAVVAERLQLLLYSGAAAHYFPKYREEVERLFDSIRTT